MLVAALAAAAVVAGARQTAAASNTASMSVSPTPGMLPNTVVEMGSATYVDVPQSEDVYFRFSLTAAIGFVVSVAATDASTGADPDLFLGVTPPTPGAPFSFVMHSANVGGDSVAVDPSNSFFTGTGQVRRAGDW